MDKALRPKEENPLTMQDLEQAKDKLSQRDFDLLKQAIQDGVQRLKVCRTSDRISALSSWSLRDILEGREAGEKFHIVKPLKNFRT